jgi:hypothetical protein
MIERFFEALNYEQLCRHDISDGIDLAAHAQDFRVIYNTIHPPRPSRWPDPSSAAARPDHQHSRPRICLRSLTRDRIPDLASTVPRHRRRRPRLGILAVL